MLMHTHFVVRCHTCFVLKNVLYCLQGNRGLHGPCVFDLPSAGPGGSEVAGGREKTKTRKQAGPGGPALHAPTYHGGEYHLPGVNTT